MKTNTLDQLRDHVLNDRFEEAAGSVNSRYREISGEILGVFEKVIKVLCQPSLSHDLQSMRSLLKLGRPSPRHYLREFIAESRNQNCLTAVIRNLEEGVPSEVRMGFTGVSDSVRKSDYAATYQTDIVDYEADFSRLTDLRLRRLLSSPPNRVDLELFDEDAAAKKEELASSFQRESLEPVKEVFLTVLEKCDDFFAHLEEFAGNFDRFFERFREDNFVTGDGPAGEWKELGDEYFNLEVVKSSLMLPISPKALYWGMQKEYPLTLEKLRELHEIVTPQFEIADSEPEGRELVITVTCRNPQSLRAESLILEPTFHFLPSGMTGKVSFETEIAVLEPETTFLCRLIRRDDGGVPLSLTVRVTCEAKYYSQPFVKEKSFHLV